MRRMPVRVGLLAVLPVVFALVSVSAQPSRGKYGNSDAISEAELRNYMYVLASDQMEGRNTPSRGYDMAALYIASHLERWGVKPGGSTTGTNGPLQPYFMPIELVSHQIDADRMRLSLSVPAPAGRAGGRAGGAAGFGGGNAGTGPRTFQYGRDWTVGAGGGGRGGATAGPATVANAPLVFVGHGYAIAKTKVDPYQGLDVRGKVLVVAGVPAELAAAQAAGRGGRGGAGANPLGVEGTDFTTPQANAVKHGALGIVMVPTFQQLSAMASPATGRGAGPNGPPYQVVAFQSATPSVPTITAGPTLVNAIFQGEKLSGAQVFEGATARTRLDSFALNPEKRLSLDVAVSSLKGFTENVIGIVEGSDPVLKGEYVVMSAHLDHVGFAATPNESGDNINNGADDDASGSVALMAIARAYAQGAARGIRPKRSVIFLWVTGEEKGLWGSRYFNQFPPVDITKIVADLNLDMIARTKTPGYVDPPSYRLIEPDEVFVVGPDISSDDLGKVVRSVAADYGKITINPFYDTTAPTETRDNLGPQPNGQRIFYRSDHYNFAKNGIPVAFFCDGLHTDYHRVTDSPDRLDYKTMLAITKTVSGVGWTLATASARPKLNATLPERLVMDMKDAHAQGWGKLTPVLPPLPGMPF